ncbi:unnamed protein product [Bursaphelenchus okinawaensis]|uniref:Pyridoxal phosphate homeostasis protein n=1 Tax=Bursaphelenchus okinawaensis TaxID=465554 RepID=A0A811KVK8_9BILA|nr:unnamed protein product [Bursaphelenchus okinawaensis]CAG9112683.1 unnamed protein product [Bursaphelenchus okinawaensis]
MSEILSAQVIQNNVKLILMHIRNVCNKVGRADVPRLVAVGKTFPASQTQHCYEAGQRHFGENYVNELEEKSNGLKELCPDIQWHFIGKVQTNKIKKIVECPNISFVETLDSEKHAQTFQNYCSQLQKQLNVFVQVNTSGEVNKNGVEPAKVFDLVSFVKKECPNLTFKGLMTIGSIQQSQKADENQDFKLMRQIRSEVAEKCQIPEVDIELSMGMSNDFSMAIEYGSTNVRMDSSEFYGLTNVPIPKKRTAEKQNDDFRNFFFRANFLDKVDGSGYVEMGNTCVLCSIEGPVEKDREMDEDVEDENPIKITSDELTEEHINVLDQILETFVRTDQLVNVEIRINVKVVCDDGGLLAAATMAVGLALASTNVQIYDIPLAATVLIPSRTATVPLLDPTASEFKNAKQDGGGVLTVVSLPAFTQIAHQYMEGVMTSKQTVMATEFAFKNSLRLYEEVTQTLKNMTK